MGEIEEITRRLSQLPLHLRFAFATICAERCFSEMDAYWNAFGAVANAHRSLLRSSLDDCWRRLRQSLVSYDEAARELHENLGALIPCAEDEPDFGIADVVIRLAYALCEAFMLLKDETNSAKLAALAGSEVIYVRSAIYSDAKMIRQHEYDWQRATLSTLEGMPTSGISKSILQDLGDYPCGTMIPWE